MGERPAKRLKNKTGTGNDSDKENCPPTERDSPRKRKIPLKRRFSSEEIYRLEDLPYDVLEPIFNYLPLEDLMNLSLVSSVLQENVDRYFSSRYKCFNFQSLMDELSEQIPIALAKLLIHRFGHLMIQIRMPIGCFRPFAEEILVRFILANCKSRDFFLIRPPL